MEFLDRYLQGLKFWLPRDQQDIAAEIADDIRSEVEEKEAALGRKLTESELEGVLKQRGNPLLVAQRYLPQRYLIGPVLFPVYRLLLRAALLYAVPWMLVWLGMVLFMPSYRAAHPGLALVGTLHSLWVNLSSFFLALTVGFALIEKYWLPAWLAREWNPRPDATRRDETRIPRYSSISSLVWNGLLALWWSGVIGLPHIPEVEVTAAPALLQYFYWPILLLLAACCALAAVNTVSATWTRRRAAASFSIEVLGVLLASALLLFRFSGGHFVEAASQKAGSAALAQFSYWMNVSIAVALILIAVGYAVSAYQDWRRWHAQPGLRNWMTDLVGGH